MPLSISAASLVSQRDSCYLSKYGCTVIRIYIITVCTAIHHLFPTRKKSDGKITAQRNDKQSFPLAIQFRDILVAN